MKYFRILLSTTMVLAALLMAVVPAMAAEESFGFETCSNNNATNVATGEAQLRVTVTDEGVAANQVKFIFENIGDEASSITDVYFDDGHLLGIASVINGSGVNFSQGASPGDLPAGNNCIPAFEATAGFTADSNPPAQPNGVNPGETLEIIFDLIGGHTYADIVADLMLPGGDENSLRIGIHVQGFANGGSESFVNEGFTAITLVSFDGRASRGQTTLKWVTGTEVANAGFNLYRSTAADGARVRVNGAMLAAQGGVASGASYTSVDAPGYGTFYYWLEDVSFSGGGTLHGPVKVTVLPAFRIPVYRPTSPAGN